MRTRISSTQVRGLSFAFRILGGIFALCLSCNFSFASGVRGSAEDLYYQAADLESRAATPSQWEEAANAYLEAFLIPGDQELSAAALFAAAQILETRAGKPARALELYKKVIKEFPGSRWTAKAENRLNSPAPRDDPPPDSRQSSKNRQSSEDSQPERTPGSFTRKTIPFDPARLTPDLLEPISAAEAARIRSGAEAAANAPHMPPEPADAEPTGDSVLDTQANNAAGAEKEIRDYTVTLEMRNPGRNLKEIVIVKASIRTGKTEKFAILFKGFHLFSSPNGQKIYFPRAELYSKPLKSTRASEVIESIVSRLAFALELGGARERLAAHHSGFDGLTHTLELYFTQSRGPVCFTVNVSKDMKLLTNFSIRNFETRETIVEGHVLEFSVNQGLETTDFEPPASASAGPVPDEFTVPAILAR